MTNDEIENLRKKMESLPTWPELGYLKTELRLALEFLREKSLSPEDNKRVLKLANDIAELNTRSDTKGTVEKIRGKLISFLSIIFPEKKY